MSIFIALGYKNKNIFTTYLNLSLVVKCLRFEISHFCCANSIFPHRIFTQMTRLVGNLGKIILAPNKGTRILGHKTKVWCENSCGFQITV